MQTHPNIGRLSSFSRIEQLKQSFRKRLKKHLASKSDLLKLTFKLRPERDMQCELQPQNQAVKRSKSHLLRRLRLEMTVNQLATKMTGSPNMVMMTMMTTSRPRLSKQIASLSYERNVTPRAIKKTKLSHRKHRRKDLFTIDKPGLRKWPGTRTRIARKVTPWKSARTKDSKDLATVRVWLNVLCSP